MRMQTRASRAPGLRSGPRRWALLLAVLGLALGLRLLALSSLLGTPYGEHLVIDESVYHSWALQLAHGTWEPTTVYRFSPLYAYVLALVYAAFGASPLHARILSVLLGTATCLLVYLLGRSLEDRRTGLLAALAVALYQPLILYNVVPLKTSLSVCLFALILVVLVHALREPRSGRLFGVGILLGLLPAVRGHMYGLIPFVPGLALWSAYRRRASGRELARVGGLVLGGLALAMTPFAVRNYVVAGEFTPTTRQASYNFFVANHLGSEVPYYRPVPFVEPFPRTQEAQFRIAASLREGRTLSTSESSMYWVRRTLASAAEEPARFLEKLGRKALAVFHRFEAGDHYDVDLLGRVAPFFAVPLLGFWAVLPLGMAGMALTFRRSPATRSLALLFVVYVSTLVLFYSNARYRLPLVVILIPFAVLGLRHLAARIRRREIRGIAAYAALVIGFALLEHLPLRGTEDRSGAYNIHATTLARSGRREEALRYWRRSAGMEGDFSPYARIALARSALSEGRVEEARARLRPIDDDSFASASKYEVLGDAFRLEGRPGEAVAAYRRSLEVNPARIAPRRKLIEVLRGLDPAEARAERARLRYIQSFYEGS